MGLSRLMDPLQHHLTVMRDDDAYLEHDSLSNEEYLDVLETFNDYGPAIAGQSFFPSFERNKNVLQVPFYTLKISKAWEEDIIKCYGDKAISKNIITMFNLWLNRYMEMGIRIYDYNVLSSSFYRKILKDNNFKVTELLSKYLQKRQLRNGRYFSTKAGIAVHYRIKPSVLKTLGVDVHLKYHDIEVEDQIFELDSLTTGVNDSLKHIKFSIDLDNLDACTIVKTFGSSAAKRFQAKLYREETGTYIGFNKSFKYELKFEERDYNAYHELETKLGSYRMYNSLMLFAARNNNTKRNTKNLRLHNRLLELPKECLAFLRIDGERLAEIDLKNSQVALLLNILAGNIDASNQEWSIFEFIDSGNLKALRKEFSNINSPYYHLLKSTQEGKVYETLMSLQEGISRDEAKKLMMLVLFSGFKTWNKRFLESNPVLQYWKDTYPILHDIITKLKRGFYYELKKKGLIHPLSEDKTPYQASKALLPVFLQRVESSLFIDNILNDLQDKGITAISKHDAIICKESDIYTTEEIMRRKHLDNLIGVNNYELDKGVLETPSEQMFNILIIENCNESIESNIAA